MKSKYDRLAESAYKDPTGFAADAMLSTQISEVVRECIAQCELTKLEGQAVAGILRQFPKMPVGNVERGVKFFFAKDTSSALREFALAAEAKILGLS